MKLLTLVSSINGDNWPSLDTELGLTLEAVSDSDLTIRNLFAMHLLQGMQVAGQKNSTWAAAHLELIKIRPKTWHKDANGKPIGSRQFSTRPATLSKYSTKMSTTNRSRPIAFRPFCPANRRLLWAKNARIALVVCSTASITAARSLNGVWNSLPFAANPATKSCSAMLMLGLT